MANPYGAIWVRQLSALCDDSLWIGGGFHEGGDGVLHCTGVFKARGQLPSGQNPTEHGLCTCACHKSATAMQAEDNALAWQQWERNRAPMIDNGERRRASVRTVPDTER